PEQAYHDDTFDGDVQHALDELPPDFRAAVVLCDIEGLSYEEIAATRSPRWSLTAGPWRVRGERGPRAAATARGGSGCAPYRS
ncbi:MAG: polymerase sigma-70 factor, subfamily, partial [Actinomycetota bacterium]|nr:polymerase sigma-70 factor, subfamily [Actinomycetota bacterium]